MNRKHSGKEQCLKKGREGGLAGSVRKTLTPDLGVVGSNPTLGIEINKINKLKKKQLKLLHDRFKVLEDQQVEVGSRILK